MNNPFVYIPDKECVEAFRALCIRLDDLRDSDAPEDLALWRELEAGKMLGVLISSDVRGNRHTLYAFSGQLGDCGFNHPLFVEPVFDYLHPEGYFKRGERRISSLTRELEEFRSGTYTAIKKEYEEIKRKLEAETEECRERYRRSKLSRDARRSEGDIGENEQALMIRQSQFEKGELRRMKKYMSGRLAPYAEALSEAGRHMESLREQRRRDSENLQKWLFSNFRVSDSLGRSRSLTEIFADTTPGIPPSGAGECCAPKLLNAAYARGWIPLSIAEYWYGPPKRGEVRIHGSFYPACRGKCLPLLRWMLRGLDVIPSLDGDVREGEAFEPKIVFENQWFCVVDKPSGMLSVPGKGREISVLEWLTEKYGETGDVRPVHRLDRDTSGLLIAAFGGKSQRILQSLFASRNIKKTYVAELEGDYMQKGIARKGCVELPLIPDWLDRPRQRVDFKEGKEAVTDYEFIGVNDNRSRVIFHPHTGRTHQLRLHSSSCHGLGMPIAGDKLYGSDGGRGYDRLRLHASRIEFSFPGDGNEYCFESPVPF